MRAFLNPAAPTVTTMLKARRLDALKTEIAEARSEDTQALGMDIATLPRELKGREFFEKFLALTGDFPLYFCNYRRTNSDKSLTDETLAEQLLMLLELSEPTRRDVIIDVAGNLYDPSPIEISCDETVIARQKALLNEIHARGGLALMSSHMFKFMKPEEVLELARAHKSRGADVSKIVTDANTPEELYANMEASLLLRRELGIPSLFLCNGESNRAHRLLSPILGSSMALCVVESSPQQNQPKLRLTSELSALFAEHELGVKV